MLQTEVTITNNSCGVVHLIGEQFEARIDGFDEFTGTMPASVFDANAAQFALSHPYVEIVEGETADDGVPEPVSMDSDKYHGIQLAGALSFDNSTHVFLLSNVTYWYLGNRFISSGAIECDLDSASDRDHASAELTANTLYHIYFKDISGKLYWSPNFWDLKTMVPVALVYWSGTAGAIGKETHNHTRDIDWHINAHLTIGARYYNGLDKLKPTIGDDAVLQIGYGHIGDEDIFHTITEQSVCRIFHLCAADKYTFIDSSLPYAGSVGAPQYLKNTTYELTAVTGSKYANYWVYATGDTTRPIYIIPTAATAPYNTVALARAETPPVLAGFGLTPEIKLIHKLIYRGDGEFQESVDYRLASSLPAGFIASTAAGSVSLSPIDGLTSSNLQSAIEELLSKIPA